MTIEIAGMRMDRPKLHKSARKYMTDDELSAFFEAIPEENVRDRLIFMLMLRMGLRVSEVVGDGLDYWTLNGARIPLRDVPDELYDTLGPNQQMDGYAHVVSGTPGIFVEDIDWTERTLFVRGKGGKERMVPIPQQTFDMLFAFVEPHKNRTSGRLITKANRLLDEPITPITVRKMCRIYGKNVPHRAHPHAFRHSFAVKYIKAKGDIRVLQKLLGHSKLATTEKYLDYVGEDIKADVDRTMEEMARTENLDKKLSREEKEKVATKVAKTVLDELEGT